MLHVKEASMEMYAANMLQYAVNCLSHTFTYYIISKHMFYMYRCTESAADAVHEMAQDYERQKEV